MERSPRRYRGDTSGPPRAQEERLAGKLGGRRRSGSGSNPMAPGDVVVPELLVEAKQTKHASISVTLAWLNKISREAALEGKEPALAIEIRGGDLDPHCERDWVAIPARVLRRLLDRERG